MKSFRRQSNGAIKANTMRPKQGGRDDYGHFVDLCGLSAMMIKMHISEADEWAIHNRASHVVFSQDGLGTGQQYNSKLNNHERVTEYAESLGAEMVVARYFGLDYDINENKAKVKADVGKGLEVRWTSYINGSLSSIHTIELMMLLCLLSVDRLSITLLAGCRLKAQCKSISKIRAKTAGGSRKNTLHRLAI
jgi:hypothetical protein